MQLPNCSQHALHSSQHASRSIGNNFRPCHGRSSRLGRAPRRHGGGGARRRRRRGRAGEGGGEGSGATAQSDARARVLRPRLRQAAVERVVAAQPRQDAREAAEDDAGGRGVSATATVGAGEGRVGATVGRGIRANSKVELKSCTLPSRASLRHVLGRLRKVVEAHADALLCQPLRGEPGQHTPY